MPAAHPLVSVVIATYNRADILPYAVRSALASEGVAVEVIVIGDACSDGTAQAVEAIGDDRVRFVNLPRNWGEQSVPSNEGIALARGAFVAFLNHDDLFLPWHLADLVARHAAGADVAWSPGLVAHPGPSGEDGEPGFRYDVAGLTPDEDFDPSVIIIASLTSYRRDVLTRLHGWRRASQTVLSPSQDLLFRAHRAGCRVLRTARPSVLVLYSGERRGAYARPSAREHAWLFARVSGDREALLLDLLGATLGEPARQLRAIENTSSLRYALGRVQRLVRRLSRRCGWHPEAWKLWLRHRGRGGFINDVRRRGGLDAIDFGAREHGPENAKTDVPPADGSRQA